MWDVERWDAVKTVREIREKVRREDKALKARPGTPVTDKYNKYKRNLVKRREWLSQGTLACAAKLLLGRDAFAGLSAINSSYKKIEATLKGPSPPAGAWFDDPFLKELGLQGLQERKSGRNIVDIFDLT